MADSNSFDVTTGCDLQEVDNAVNQATKELTQRYDFRNVTFSVVLKRDDNTLTLSAPDEFKLQAKFLGRWGEQRAMQPATAGGPKGRL